MFRQTWRFGAAVLASWVNRQQQEAIEYLKTENRILRQKLGKKRVLLNDDQRRPCNDGRNGGVLRQPMAGEAGREVGPR